MIDFTIADIESAFGAPTIERGYKCWQDNKVLQYHLPLLNENKIATRVYGSNHNVYVTSVRVSPQADGSTKVFSYCSCPVQQDCKHGVALLFDILSKKTDTGFIENPAVNTSLKAILKTETKVEGKTRLSHRIITEGKKGELPEVLQGSLKSLKKLSVKKEQSGYSPTVKQRLLYILNIVHQAGQEPYVSVKLETANVLKTGKLGKPRRYSIHTAVSSQAKFILDSDHELLQALDYASRDQRFYDVFCLSGTVGVDILKQLLLTERCFWQQVTSDPIRMGDARKGKLEWVADMQGYQRCIVVNEVSNGDTSQEGTSLIGTSHADTNQADASQSLTVLPLSSLYYLDVSTAECGPLTTELSDQFTRTLIQFSEISPEHAKACQTAIRKELQSSKVKIKADLLPITYKKSKAVNVVPTPCLHLFEHEVESPYVVSYGDTETYPMAHLQFDYSGIKVGMELRQATITQLKENELVTINLNTKAEERALQQLSVFELIYAKDSEEFYSRRKQLLAADYYLLMDDEKRYEIPPKASQGTSWNTSWLDDDFDGEEDEEDVFWYEFNRDAIPVLRQQGWQITYEPGYPYNSVTLPDDWYGEIDESSGINWFELELGVVIDDEKINVLPLLVTVLSQKPKSWIENLSNMDEKETIRVRLADARFIDLPIARIRPVLNILVELFDQKPLTEDGKLQLSAARSTQLSELDEVFSNNNFHWFGGEKVRRLGEKLKDFKGITQVQSPKNLNAELRDYQKEGLSWLQFLREYKLGGILADDMGLGKTVQILAHIQEEKNAGRLVKPCLIVAPTSLMVNWREEANRFTPDLSVLILQGDGRQEHFDKIEHTDIVLTTYPLLPRDKDCLLKNDYYAVILDEAQAIKNPKAQATKIVHQITSEHRLCLTGTPLENHLGELWSQLDFLNPGLLGDARQFKKIYRTPIEKHQDVERNNRLQQRIAPFLLRRTKDQVLTELPKKTEIIRVVELSGSQQMLYESIRLSMHKKVTSEIKKKGLNRSHIIILNALLKLRQVCCHPQLLSLESAKEVKESAKLNLLMDMLPEMVEEGRKILLFSQFTSMLKIIESELTEMKLDYVKLTGSTKDRTTPVRQFQQGQVPIFLISLKAGGVGLNLTAADTVIHYDPWWNPAVENQATDRAHRIGQEKAVFVYKLISKHTVEEKINELQQRKKALADNLLTGKLSSAQLSGADIEALFG